MTLAATVRIAYDYQIFSLQEYGGISRYFTELASRVARFENCEVSILAMAHLNGHLREAPAGLVRGAYVPYVRKAEKIRRLTNDWLTRMWLWTSVPDVVHETYYSPKRLASTRSRVVLTVYDMIHEKFPHSFRRGDTTRQDKARAVKRADHIICISTNTSADLVQWLRVDPAKVSVVYPGCSLVGKHESATAPGVSGPYLLYVGDRTDYKNFDGLLRAIAASRALRDGVRLVCYGGGSLRPKELSLVRDLGLREGSVVHLDGGDGLLARLYKHASALVYPSLYEGFGMPVLEAMSFECPVVCSNTSSLPEVAGQAAELFDPTDTTHMAAAIENVLSSAERAATLRTLGTERVKLFSWKRCATETYDVYRSLL